MEAAFGCVSTSFDGRQYCYCVRVRLIGYSSEQLGKFAHSTLLLSFVIVKLPSDLISPLPLVRRLRRERSREYGAAHYCFFGLGGFRSSLPPRVQSFIAVSSVSISPAFRFAPDVEASLELSSSP